MAVVSARSAEEAERAALGLDTQAPIAVLTADDIEAYDPASGALALAPSSIERLARDAGIPARELESILVNGCFVLAIGGRRLFGGLTLPIGSANGTDIPTIYPRASGSGLRLLVRPTTNPDRPLDQFAASAQSRVHADELRSFFASVGRLAPP